MAPARKKSRKLGLEEEAPGGGGGGGGGGERVSSSSEEENKKLYVFVMHETGNYPYSLFALDIPSPGTIVKTVVTPPSYETVKGVEPSRTEPERSPVRPILRFNGRERWARFMKCIRLKQKLYFLGGDLPEEWSESYPREVYALDLSQEVKPRRRDRADKVVEQVASMNTGKGGTIVYFVADGKIFLVAGRKKEGQLVPFEIFDQGVWKIGAAPPFEDDAHIFPPLVVGRKAFFCGLMTRSGYFTCCHTIDNGTWIEYSVRKEDFYFPGFCGGFHCSSKDLASMVAIGVAGGVAVAESTIWNVVECGNNNVPTVVRFDITNKQVKKKYFNSVLKYYIPHPPCPDEDDPDANPFPSRPGTFLTRAEEDSRRLLFLQVEDVDVDPGRIRMSIILFDTPAGRESPKYLTSAHYVVKLEPRYPTYTLMDAHIV